MSEPLNVPESTAKQIRLFVFGRAAETGRIPQPPEIAKALELSEINVTDGLRQLAASRVLILAPNSDNIWAANPF